MKWSKYLFISIFLLCLVLHFELDTVYADLTGCSVSISPETVAIGSTTDYSVNITNQSDEDSGNWIQIYMLTNLAGQKDAETALSMGAVKYIVKSEYDPKQVSDMVKEVLKGYTRDEIPS